VIVVVENDAVLSKGIEAARKLRDGGMAVELVASGSPKKRFDKARKENPKALLSFDQRDAFQSNLRGDADVEASIRSILNDPAFDL
jgi:histidyl-tRNA synthetase